jgi:hypothetical protein
MTESEIVAELMKMYQQMVEEDVQGKKAKIKSQDKIRIGKRKTAKNNQKPRKSMRGF